jgi:hypothetical protein
MRRIAIFVAAVVLGAVAATPVTAAGMAARGGKIIVAQ